MSIRLYAYCGTDPCFLPYNGFRIKEFACNFLSITEISLIQVRIKPSINLNEKEEIYNFASEEESPALPLTAGEADKRLEEAIKPASRLKGTKADRDCIVEAKYCISHLDIEYSIKL